MRESQSPPSVPTKLHLPRPWVKASNPHWTIWPKPALSSWGRTESGGGGGCPLTRELLAEYGR